MTPMTPTSHVPATMHGRALWVLPLVAAVLIALTGILIVAIDGPGPAYPVDAHATAACRSVTWLVRAAPGGAPAATNQALQHLQTIEVQGSESENAAVAAAAKRIIAASTASSLEDAMNNAMAVCQSLKLSG